MRDKGKYFRHEAAIVESSAIGHGTRIWAFVHVLSGAQIGADCNICEQVFVENDVILGDRVTIKCGVQLWDGVRIEDDVFIGPNVTFTNDPWPRSREWKAEYAKTIIKKGASIGANATLLAGITIGAHSMIGAGSVVTRSVPPNAVVVGNPARIVRYTGLDEGGRATKSAKVITHELEASPIQGVEFDSLPLIHDLRGNLFAREIGKGLRFEPRRYFIICDVPSKEVRGEHAHKICQQLLVCVRGSVACVVDNGKDRAEYVLDSPEKALYIPPMIWATQYKYSRDCMLLVFASHEYDPGDYIRDYEEFWQIKSKS